MLALVALTAAGFLLQGIALLIIAGRVKSAVAQTQKVLGDVERRTSHLMLQAGGLIESLRPLSETARSLSDSVGQIMETARRRADAIDSFLEEVTGTIKVQAGKLDYVVSDTVQKFEETTAAIQREVLVPAMEVSSLIKGIRTGFDYFFSSGKRGRATAAVPQDEELFI